MRTVLSSYIISSLISAAVMVSLWSQNRRRSPELAFWLADFSMQFIGVLLIELRGYLPDFFTMVLSNTLIIGGTLLLLIGLERYTKKTSPQWFNYIYVLAFFLVQMYFVYIQDSLQVRTINNSIGILLMCAQCAWLLIRRVEPGLRPETRPVGLVFGLFSLVSLARICVDLAAPQGNDLFKSGLYDTLGVLSYQMLYVSLTFTLVLMVNRRLRTALEDDIADRKRAEAALKISEEKFSVAFQNSPDAIVISSFPDGKIIDVNEGFSHITRFNKDEALGRTTIELDLWGSLDRRNEFLDAIRKEHRVVNFEANFRKKSGEAFTGLISGETILLQGQTCALSVIHDITERKLAEEALRKSEAELRALFASMHDVVLVIDSQGVYREIAPTNPGMLVEAPEELLGKTLQDVFRPEQAQIFLDVIRQVLKSGQTAQIEYDLLIGGRSMWFQASISPMAEDRTLWVAHDITRRKHMEQEIRSLSLTDELTGLYNRRGFTLLAEQELKLSRRFKRDALLFFGDVDDLKTINDTYGHPQGDLALQEMAAILKETFREADIPARFGGDEFVVLAVDVAVENADILANHLQNVLEQHNKSGGRLWQLSISWGFASYDSEAPCKLSELISSADGQMYAQKQARQFKS
jgi:diguanylate cyclase (GGDEF)-like protein/PAS domain S-box-containing protein